MSWIADAHREWHLVNGRWGCPLDCAESDAGVEADIAEGSLPVVAIVEGREFTTRDAAHRAAATLAKEWKRAVKVHYVRVT